MVIALLALVGICWAFVYKRTRPFALLGLAALVGYIIYDNFISEAPLTGEYYEVKESKVTELSPVTFKLVMKIKNLHKTADLESVNVNVDLQEKTIKYQITSISSSDMTLQARHNIQFYIDGDEKRKAAYSLVVIQLKRK